MWVPVRSDRVDTYAVNQIEAMITPLYGVPSWRALNSHGSMFLLDFGPPSVEIHEPRVLSTNVDGAIKETRQRRVSAHGQWTLCIELCDWTIDVDGWLLAHDQSRRTTIDRALGVLQGQALSEVAIEPGSGAAIFTFDLGATLRTKASERDVYHDEDDEDDQPVSQWWLMGPEDRILTLRDDATFSITSAAAARSEREWRPLSEA